MRIKIHGLKTENVKCHGERANKYEVFGPISEAERIAFIYFWWIQRGAERLFAGAADGESITSEMKKCV